jgi:hypothetical protein
MIFLDVLCSFFHQIAEVYKITLHSLLFRCFCLMVCLKVMNQFNLQTNYAKETHF